MQRVCFVTSGVGRGGAEKQMFLAAAALDSRGHSVTIVSILPNDRAGAELRPKIPIVSLNAARTTPVATILWRFHRTLSALTPEVLVGFNYPGTMLARAAGLLRDVPVVISSIRTERQGGMARRLALRLTDRLSNVTTTNSSAVAHQLVEAGLVKSSRIRIVRNGIDIDAVTPALTRGSADIRRNLGVPRDAFLWVAAGRLEPPKDYPNLIAAMCQLQHGDSAALVIVGDGPLRPTLERMIDAAGLRARVRLAGFRNDVPACLAEADGVVLSSAWEGMPNVVLEALAVAVPVVCTDVGGIRELVEDRISGFIVPPGHSGALSSAMDELMKRSVEERSEMGNAGRVHVLNTFSSAAAGSTWSSLVSECWNARRECAI
jgi:glycosyltransferase involved in cell wall biosynthesis